MQRILQYITYLFFRLMVGCFAILPFSILYKLSDGLAFILEHVIGYRKSVIVKNLKSCFPEWSEHKYKTVKKTFYAHLADIFIEGIKGFTMSDSDLKKRYRIVNPNVLDHKLTEQKSVLLAGSHFNNWEWGVLILDRWLDHQVSGIYQTVKNKFIHNYLMNTRSKWGMNLISAKNAIKSIINYEKTHAVMILSDQSPSNMKYAHWVDFLNRDTPCTHGLEVMAKKTGYPIFYMYVLKIKRGFYDIHLEPLIDDPAAYEEESITSAYMERLEQTIMANPQYWLWSHDRWKRATPQHKAMKIPFRK